MSPRAASNLEAYRDLLTELNGRADRTRITALMKRYRAQKRQVGHGLDAPASLGCSSRTAGPPEPRPRR